jgi:hypothetical protein
MIYKVPYFSVISPRVLNPGVKSDGRNMVRFLEGR